MYKIYQYQFANTKDKDSERIIAVSPGSCHEIYIAIPLDSFEFDYEHQLLNEFHFPKDCYHRARDRWTMTREDNSPFSTYESLLNNGYITPEAMFTQKQEKDELISMRVVINHRHDLETIKRYIWTLLEAKSLVVSDTKRESMRKHMLDQELMGKRMGSSDWSYAVKVSW